MNFSNDLLENLYWDENEQRVYLDQFEFINQRLLLSNAEDIGVFSDSAIWKSPQTVQQKFDEAKDVWSFGVLAHLLFTGSLPQLSITEKSVSEKVRNAPICPDFVSENNGHSRNLASFSQEGLAYSLCN